MTQSVTNAMLSPGRLVAFAVIGALSTLIVLMVLVSGGLVRHVPITWQEKIETTIAFKTIANELKVVGIKGNGAVILGSVVLAIPELGFKNPIINFTV